MGRTSKARVPSVLSHVLLLVFGLTGLVLFLEWPRSPPEVEWEQARWRNRGKTAVQPPTPTEATGKLRVLDAATGDPVPGAKVHWLEWHPEDNSTTYHPVEAATAATEFRYAGPAGIVLFGIEAPGHVGTMHGGIALEISKGSGLSHDFRLERAGTLRVQFRCDGHPASPQSVRILFPSFPRGMFPGGLTAVGMDARNGIGQRDDLAEGSYGVEVTAGPDYEPVAVQPIEIRKGETADLHIDLARRVNPAGESGTERTIEGSTAPAGRWPSLRGTVKFHVAWGDRNGFVRLVREEGGPGAAENRVALRRESPGGPLRFDLGRVPPGSYWVEVQPQWRQEVGVWPDGGEVDLEVPEPARAHVRVVEDATGKPIRGSRLTWHCSSGGPEKYRDEIESPLPDSGEFLFPVPPGCLEYRVTARGWIPVRGGGDAHNGTHARIPLVSGQMSDTTVRLQPAGAVRVLVRGDGQPLSKKEVEVVLVLAEEHDGQPPGSVTQWLNGGPGLFRLEDLATVKYTLEVRDPLGLFEPSEAQTIQVLPGKTLEVAVDLKRNH